jgi:hypothetical protein
MKKLLIYILFTPILVAVTACSIYESGGREAIRTNASNIVVAEGASIRGTMLYRCVKTTQSLAQVSPNLTLIESDLEPTQLLAIENGPSGITHTAITQDNSVLINSELKNKSDALQLRTCFFESTTAEGLSSLDIKDIVKISQQIWNL